MGTVQIQLPSNVKWIIEQINQAGFEAYAVGGCIRDSILGREPNDWDITTSAKPEQIKDIFKRTIDTGIKHGTVTVMIDKEGYEITTYRIDGEYEDGRHPKEVSFTSNLLEDLKRRDFTINAMAYNETNGLVDAFGGIEDLQNGVIRCVGNPMERFTEDALRMMRAIRFSAQLGYRIDEETKNGIKTLAKNLSFVSAERIQVELVKLVVSDHPDYLRVAYETKLLQEFLPEFAVCMETPQNNPHHCYDVGEHILHSMLAVPADKVLRLTMMLHDIAKPQTLTIDKDGITHNYGHAKVGAKMGHDILRRLRFDNDTIFKVTRLIEYHDYRMEPQKSGVRKAITKIGVDLFPMYLQVQYADLAAQSDYQYDRKLLRVKEIEAIYKEVLSEGDALSLKNLVVSGSDLVAAGIKPGKELGIILQKMLERCLEDPSHNNAEYLMSYAKEVYSELIND